MRDRSCFPIIQNLHTRLCSPEYSQYIIGGYPPNPRYHPDTRWHFPFSAESAPIAGGQAHLKALVAIQQIFILFSPCLPLSLCLFRTAKKRTSEGKEPMKKSRDPQAQRRGPTVASFPSFVQLTVALRVPSEPDLFFARGYKRLPN